MDTLARIHLADGRLSECQTLLDDIDDAIIVADDRARYVYRHTQLTRLQLLGRLNSTKDALQHADFVMTLAERSGDQLLSDLTRLSRADILQATGQIAESVALWQTIVPAIPQRSPDFLAQYECVLACTIARTGEIERAEQHRRRAERIYRALKHQTGQLELARSWQAAIVDKADTRSDLRSFGPVNLGANILADIASMMLHAGRPELLAYELVHLFETAGCIDCAMAISSFANGPTEVLAQSGEANEKSSINEQRLVVGTQRDRSIEVLVTPKQDLESIATVHSISLLLATLHDLEQARAEREERATLWPVDELPASGNGAVTVGHMREVMTLARRIANANVSVLITGESGTGKEVLARALHEHSNRAQKPFIPFNCAAVPRELLESQLFGYRRGAFTGADRDNPGVIRSARDGTLFLDEIGEMGLELQPKLLRFLESGEICPLGESTPFVVNVRIVAATNSNLEGLVKEGRFREDLFYRLNVIRLSVKPLRERRDEIPTLVNHFVMRAAEEFRKTHIRLAEETMERLVLHSWPGNVRQLQNEIRRLVALAEGGAVLRPDMLSADIFKSTSRDAVASASGPNERGTTPGEKLNPTLSRIEREMIKAALREHHGKVEAAAKALGISRKGLYLKRQRLGL
jgi:transcriptional regulator with PAS, ATPase and Fis domain